MNISKSMNIILFTTLFLIFSNSLFSQKLEFGKRMTFQDHTITSKIMGYDYQLRISFPESYSTKDTISYPVLYVLNGIYDFKVAQERMSSEGEVEDVIIVGVGFENNNSLNSSTKRHYDFTPSVNTLSERKKEKFFSFPEGAVKSGGQPNF